VTNNKIPTEKVTRQNNEIQMIVALNNNCTLGGSISMGWSGKDLVRLIKGFIAF
jgi:hypothetical protein